MNHKIVVITSHKLKDQLMHAADVFESFKVLMEEPVLVDADFKNEMTLKQISDGLKEAFEKDGTHRVIAVFKPFVVEGAWCDQSIIFVSNGFQFDKFYDLLLRLNYSGPLPRRFLDEYTTASTTDERVI